jgi:hypothetical protein
VSKVTRKPRLARPKVVNLVPQAFSHIALINLAYNLDHAAKPAEQRSGAKAPETDEDQSVLF